MIEYVKLINLANIYYCKGKLKYSEKKFNDAKEDFERS
jgi:hypothetical protein